MNANLNNAGHPEFVQYTSKNGSTRVYRVLGQFRDEIQYGIMKGSRPMRYRLEASWLAGGSFNAYAEYCKPVAAPAGHVPAAAHKVPVAAPAPRTKSDVVARTNAAYGRYGPVNPVRRAYCED